MQDLMKVLFDVNTYKGCQVRRPDMHTYVVEGVKGQPICLTFRRRQKDWGSGIDVTVSRTDTNNPQEVVFYRTDQEATDQMKKFWTLMNDMAFLSGQTYQDELRQFASDVLTGKATKRKK